jgi:shikimate kinase
MDHDSAPLSMAEIARIARRLDRPVVLVGMMGVGKTTVGRKLASLLDVFVDADEEIERAAQMPIPEIFATYGEPYFRSGERRVIARLLDGATPARRKVLATGGGAFVDAETRALILDKAVSVWLDSDIDTLVERGPQGQPPLAARRQPARNPRPPARRTAPGLSAGRDPHHQRQPAPRGHGQPHPESD